MTPRYFAVQDFFLCYFHQDWQLDADSRLEVAKQFLRASDPTVIGNVIRELRELVQEPISDDDFHEMIDQDYWLSYDPSRDNVTMRAWLGGLLHELEDGRAKPMEFPAQSRPAVEARNLGRSLPWISGCWSSAVILAAAKDQWSHQPSLDGGTAGWRAPTAGPTGR